MFICSNVQIADKLFSSFGQDILDSFSGRRLSREVDAANTSEFYHTS